MGLFILFFQNSLDDVVLLTPHFAALHVGLKSLALSGHHHVALSVNPTFRKPLNAGSMRGILKGYRISAPRKAKRHVGF
ncbi:hypothetical protein Barb4_00738 [Bacteroidales bacterium Barb4]|nr:hypothetical protein Barb4_00738 [Bacteroidales bacterium Barb4]